MVLVDTSVWIDHLRRGNRMLVEMLASAIVMCHPFVHGELACGNIANRQEIQRLLADLPGAAVAQQHEVLVLLEVEALHGRGLGWIDIHLLASARLTGCRLWTLDKALASAARELGLVHD